MGPKPWLVPLVLLLAACSGAPETGPKAVKWDRDACARCRMVLSERPYAAQVRYRGPDSRFTQVALFDVLKLYGSRVVELHLRQSKDNVWSEALGDGDIDYRAVARQLLQAGVRPLLVLEQGPEGHTPQTLAPAEIHRQSVAYVREVFGEFAAPRKA